MQNILLDGFPTEYQGYPLRTDYRVGILLSLLMEDNTVDDDDIKVYQAIAVLYEKIPDDIGIAYKGLVWFLSCGRSELHFEDDDDINNNELEDKAIDFNQDSLDIWAGFKARLGIDLLKEEMHFWAFMSLLSNLGDCQLTQKIGYRTADLSELKGETKKFYSKMKEKYRIKEVLTEEEYNKRLQAIKNSPILQGEFTKKLLGIK